MATTTDKQDSETLQVVTASMVARGEHPHQLVQLTPEEEVDQTTKPLGGKIFVHTWRSLWSRNAVLSVFALNGLCCVLALNGFFSVLSVNAAFSVFSLNSILSIASVNSMLSIGCVGGWMEICGKYSADLND